MAWIKLISENDASGVLARVYDAAKRRAGKVFNILRVQSQSPESLKAGIDLYLSAMFGASPLSRAQREMLAVVVSAANNCHYWTVAHGFDLRAEVGNDELATAVQKDYRQAGLSDVDRALCDFASKLTLTPAKVSSDDVECLRHVGLDDIAISDAVQVIAYFNYINRIADGLGVDLEPGMPPKP